MEVGHLPKKSVREFLRASDVLLAEMREPHQEPFSSHELIVLKAYIERLKSFVLQIETSALEEHIPKDRAKRKTG
jgi:hypothetical protein